MSRSALILFALLCTGIAADAVSATSSTGELTATIVLDANFNADTVGQPPDLGLPGLPAGDFLTLNRAGGTVTVISSCFGLDQPIEMRQKFQPGGVGVDAWLAPQPPGSQSITVKWRSAARLFPLVCLLSCDIKSSSGALLASVDYRPLGFLKYNGTRLLPVRYHVNRAQEFAIVVDLVARTTSLSIDGASVAGFQNVPFAGPASDVARVSFHGDGKLAQSLLIDDISAIAFGQPRDRAPEVSAPETATGSEGALLHFTVSATDPDGDAIQSLAAAPLPVDASFTPDATNTSGSFDWTPGFTQAGAYSVTFTAANALSAAATTAITIGDADQPPAVQAPQVVDGEEGGTLAFSISASDPDGEAITGLSANLGGLPPTSDASFTSDLTGASGAFLWHMKQGEAGTYAVTFQASNATTGSATTTINVAVSGVSITGSLIWTPRPGEEGSHFVVFTATDEAGDIGTATTEIICTAPEPAAPATSVGNVRGTTTPQAALSPGAIQKGPVVSVANRVNGTIGQTLVITASATPGTDGASLASRGPAGDPRRAGTAAGGVAAINLTADLTEVPRAVFEVDNDPEINAPETVEADAGSQVTFAVSAADPDGDPILFLTADASGLPAPNDAAFELENAGASGTFHWTPGAADSGDYAVVFTASNNLVGTARTTIQVRGAAPARVFSLDEKRIRLSSNKSTIALYLEPIAGSFDLLDVDLASIRMISAGTGSVSDIPAVVGKHVEVGDRDCNRIQEMQICFKLTDLRLLFSNLRGNVTAHVTVAGRLTSGGFFSGGVDLRLDAGDGPHHASVFPNPLNPRATLSFVTTKRGAASVRLFDINGRLVRELLTSPSLEVGDHQVVIDGRDSEGRMLASGVYYFRIEADGATESGRLTVMK